MKNFNSSFAKVDEMNLELLLDLINVHEKLTENLSENLSKKSAKGHTYKVLD